MPDSVRGVLAARIDLLPAREKAALQAASVIGRVFWEAPVRELIGGDADFALLEERDFIRRRTGSRFPEDREHAIKHALTREAAYAGIPRARRARMHATLAEWIERSVENVGDIAALLAHHYADAVRPEDVELAWAGRRRRARANAGEGARVAPARGRRCDAALRARRRARLALAGAAARSDASRPRGRAPGDRQGARARLRGRALLAVDAGRHRRGATTSRCEASSTPSWRYESALRSGIWQQMPERTRVDDWVDRALAGAPPDSRARRDGADRTKLAGGRATVPRPRSRHPRSPSGSTTPSSARPPGMPAGSSRSSPVSTTTAARGPSGGSSCSTGSPTRTFVPTSTRRRSPAASGAGGSARRVDSPPRTTRSSNRSPLTIACTALRSRSRSRNCSAAGTSSATFASASRRR